MQQLHRIPRELLPDAQRQHDQCLAALVAHRLMAELQLLHGLTKAEAFKQRPPAAPQRPHNSVPLVRLQRRVDLLRRQCKARFAGQHDLGAQKFEICLH